MTVRTLTVVLAAAILGVSSSLSFAATAIGLNYSVPNKPETELATADVAGADAVAQDNWNNLSGPKGEMTAVKNSAGKTVDGLTVTWDATEGRGDQAWRCKVGRDWGFTGDDLKLVIGYHQLGSAMTIKGIPFANYEVWVYAAADDNAGMGKVTISKVSADGAIDTAATRFYKIGWLSGKFVRSEATTQQEATKGSNVVVFTGNSAKEIKITCVGNVQGGWTGMTAVQIVEVPAKAEANK